MANAETCQYMKNQLKHIVFAVVAIALLNACSPSRGDNPGHEYMPDMAHSIAYEVQAYQAYGRNTWDDASVFSKKQLSMPRMPVAGTIPRGYVGLYHSDPANQAAMMDVLHGKNAINAVSTPLNGRVPYYYGDSEEERGRATREIRSNPFPITEAGLAKGKDLYTINCGICHGEKADGGGYLVRDANPAAGDAGGKYPAAPANLMLDTFLLASNGRFYHAVMYGKNAMGAYADKLSFEERWQVIHYIRSLQAESQKAVYNEQENSLNPEFGVPKAKLAKAAAPAKDDAPPAGPGK